MNGKQYIQAVQVLYSRIDEPSKDRFIRTGEAWHTRMDIDGLTNGVKTVHHIGQDETVTGGRIEELRTTCDTLIEVTESLRWVFIARYETVSALITI